MRASVLLPTRGKSPTLGRVIGRVLGQTVADLELLVVGDGISDEGRATVLQRAALDGRIRFFDNPKGPRRGELHRHAALQQARGEIVCYATDDDLWLPDHVETMEALLRAANFAQAPTIVIAPGGGILAVSAADHALRSYRLLLRAGFLEGALSCGAHTLAMYRRLPFGWRTTPERIPTDGYMWQQFHAHPECRAVNGTHPVGVCFPSLLRQDWPPERLVEEWDRWAARVDAPGGPEKLYEEVLDWVMRERAALAVSSQWRLLLRQKLRILPVVGPVLSALARAARGQRAQPR